MNGGHRAQSMVGHFVPREDGDQIAIVPESRQLHVLAVPTQG